MRFATRALRTPLGVAVVATVALATAACAIVGAIVDAALFRQPPFHDASRLAVLLITHDTRAHGVERQRWSFQRFLLLRDAVRPTLFTDVASFSRASTLTLTGTAEPEPLDAEVVSSSYFRLLGLDAAVGRTLLSADATSATDAEVVIGYDLWRRRFAGDSAIVGQHVALNGVRFAVVGIAPPRFAGLTGSAELWIAPEGARQVSYAGYLSTNQNFISVVGRLAPGVTLTQAATALAPIGAAIQRVAPSASSTPGEHFAATALSLNAARVDPRERQWILLLLGGVGFLFLLACANVANLLIVRAIARRRELAIRTALGASPVTIARSLFGDGALMVLTGAALGAVAAGMLLPVLPLPARLIAPRNMYGSIGAFATPVVDARFVAISIGIAVVAALVCAAIPALLPHGVDLTRDLKDGAPNTTLAASPRRLTMKSAMIALETALALMLLVGGGLTVESYRRLRAAPLGFESGGLLTFWLRPSEVAYPPARAPTLIEGVLAEIARLPGVAAASVDGCTPVSTGCANSTLYVVGRPQPKPQDAPPVLRHYVAPGHFATLGVALLRGRLFTDDDRAGRRRVAIINRLAAQRFFPNEDPIGQRVWFGGGSNFDRPDSAAEIVGIVGDVAYQALDERPIQPDFYTPYLQFTYASRAVLVRSSGDAAALVPSIRRAIQRVDPSLAMYDVRTMEERLGDASAGRRFDTSLLSAFGVIALLIAATGIYAVVAHSVAQRTREVGVRMALGARGEDVVAMVIREGMTLPTIGLMIGTSGSLALTRVLQSALYGTSATNPLVYFVLIVLLSGCATVACYLPARKAAAVDPLVALKS